MKGSEKQIAWVEKIKLEIIEKMERDVQEAHLRVKSETMPDYYAMIADIVFSKAIKNIEAKFEEFVASYIIDRRNSLPFYDDFDNGISSTYEKCKDDLKRQEKVREMHKALNQ